MKLLSFLPYSLHFKSIDSTQNFLKRKYKKLFNLTFVFSDFQTEGRGRHGRKWVSANSANLLFSFLIKNPKLVKRFDSLSIFIAVTLKELLTNFGLDNVEIKWPNDVYVNSKKIAGILLEGINEGSKLKALVIGIGLNVNQDEFNDDLRVPATSLKLELDKEVSIKTLRKETYKLFYKNIKNIDSVDYLKIANDSNFLKNKYVSFEYNGETVFGEAKEINKDNSITIIKDNDIIKVKSGEVNNVKIDK